MASGLRAFGLSMVVPAGWEAEIDGGGGDAVGEAMTAMPRVHVANFALPEVRGDFGSGATEGMRRNGVFLCLLEEDPAMATTRLYAADSVPRLAAADFHPNQMQRPVAGQSGAQAFFHIKATGSQPSASPSARAFVVYAVAGDHNARAVVAARLNEILSTLRFD